MTNKGASLLGATFWLGLLALLLRYRPFIKNEQHCSGFLCKRLQHYRPNSP